MTEETRKSISLFVDGALTVTCIVGGIASCVYGAHLAWPPLGWMVAGAFLLAIAIGGARRSAP